MRSVLKCKKGITLVELIVSISLFVALIGALLAIFISTNKVYSSGTSLAEAKELSSQVFLEIENTLQSAESVTLKNGNFGDKSIISIDNKVLGSGSNLVDYDSRMVHMNVVFKRENEDTLVVVISVSAPYKKTIYSEQKSIKLNNLPLYGNKIYVQSEGLISYSGLDYI